MIRNGCNGLVKPQNEFCDGEGKGEFFYIGFLNEFHQLMSRIVKMNFLNLKTDFSYFFFLLLQNNAS